MILLDPRMSDWPKLSTIFFLVCKVLTNIRRMRTVETVDRVVVVVGQVVAVDRTITTRVVMSQGVAVGRLPKERTQVVKVVHLLERAQRRLEKHQAAVDLGLVMNWVVSLVARSGLPLLKPFAQLRIPSPCSVSKPTI